MDEEAKAKEEVNIIFNENIGPTKLKRETICMWDEYNKTWKNSATGTGYYTMQTIRYEKMVLDYI